MKISQKDARQAARQNWGWLVVLLLVFGLGLWLGQTGVWELLRQEWVASVGNLRASDTADLPTLIIDMPFANYSDILRQREQALADGVFIGSAADFVAATMELEGVVVPVRLRLLPGTAVHLDEGDKWNFDVRTRNDALLRDMQRFQLRDPADNNWLNEWAFLESLRREGILTTRYSFVNVRFNGDEWGIYALQEGFGAELAMAQGRPNGVTVEFDTERLWQTMAAYDGDVEAALADPLTDLSADKFQLFEVDTFRDATIADDPALSAQQAAAIGLLRGLQAGELTAAQVFDVAQYGRFLALADLWGATGAVQLTHLRYYFDAENGRLQPIGFNGNPLSGDGRIPISATYNDPDLQAAYVQALVDISRDSYLTQLQAELQPEWEVLREAVGVEPALRRGEVAVDPPWQALAQRQTLLQQSLNPTQPVFAYLGAPELSANGIVQIDVANVLNVPVEILGFDVAGATFLEPDEAWLVNGRYLLPAFDAQTGLLPYTRIHMPLLALQDTELTFTQELEIRVATRITGHDQTQLTLARPGYPDPFAHQTQPNVGDPND
jgi:hypothetical protein